MSLTGKGNRKAAIRIATGNGQYKGKGETVYVG